MERKSFTIWSEEVVQRDGTGLLGKLSRTCPYLGFRPVTDVAMAEGALYHGPARSETLSLGSLLIHIGLFIFDSQTISEYCEFTDSMTSIERIATHSATATVAKEVIEQPNVNLESLKQDPRTGQLLGTGRKGTLPQQSCPYTSEQNGRAERKHRQILDSVRALLISSSCPKRFWGEAALIAAYLINRIPSSILNNQSSYERLHVILPAYNLLKVFGCACFVLFPPHEHNKLEPRAQLCYFLGYGITQKRYRCWDHASQKLRVSRHVVFWEHTMFSSLSNFKVSSSHQPQYFTNPSIELFPSDSNASTFDELYNASPHAPTSSIEDDLPTGHALDNFEPSSTSTSTNELVVPSSSHPTWLTPMDGSPLSDPTRYRQLVGSLVYLTTTRPNIVYPVHIVSQFMAAPRSTHYAAVLGIIRYVKGTLFHGLHFSANSSPVLRAYSDADWASDPSDRRSTTGYCLFLGNSLISWRSKKQAIPSRSSTEAEYRALGDTTLELLSLRWLLEDMGIPQPSSTDLYCDNQSAMQIAHNDVFHERTKHIEVDCHFIRHHVAQGTVHLVFIGSADQPADLFTKAHFPRRFRTLLSKLKLVSSQPP
ncbi:hypothetical protein SLEP1_g1668 [Rubroshorea leprosula]|uniref:Retroviral polymerase SH3-like domain-containing protein n=1 Tax=Rubroshorea leprosula TaxID=152421 RepID=A0AAV5HKF4_9ROSI|nr:hypothetical protein SLEP1_g1668 [Rubroshorea leprosula]